MERFDRLISRSPQARGRFCPLSRKVFLGNFLKCVESIPADPIRAFLIQGERESAAFTMFVSGAASSARQERCAAAHALTCLRAAYRTALAYAV